MYAIVEIANEQVKVIPKSRCYTAKLPYKVGEKVIFEEDKILLIEDEKGPTFGMPFVKGSKVVAEVINHVKGSKVITFKMQRRKGRRVKRGHRQDHTELLIKTITKK